MIGDLMVWRNKC